MEKTSFPAYCGTVITKKDTNLEGVGMKGGFIITWSTGKKRSVPKRKRTQNREKEKTNTKIRWGPGFTPMEKSTMTTSIKFCPTGERTRDQLEVGPMALRRRVSYVRGDLGKV